MAGFLGHHIGAHDVIVEHCLDLLMAGFRPQGITGAPDETEFLAGEGDEYNGLLKMVPAHHASKFEDDRRAACIVICARRRRFGRFFTRYPQIDGIVMSVYDDALFRLRGAGEHSNDAGDFGGALLLDIVRDFEPRTVAVELSEDPAARRANAPALLVGV